MGVTIGSLSTVIIGLYKDVAWSQALSAGKRFTLHELTLVPGVPTSCVLDDQPENVVDLRRALPKLGTPIANNIAADRDGNAEHANVSAVPDVDTQGLLTYGQSINPASPHANDQMKLYSAKQRPTRPFHADDVAQQRVGEVLRLTRP